MVIPPMAQYTADCRFRNRATDSFRILSLGTGLLAFSASVTGSRQRGGWHSVQTPNVSSRSRVVAQNESSWRDFGRIWKLDL